MRLRRRTSWKIKIGAAATATVLIIGAVWWLALPLPQNYETEVPVMAKSYSVTPVSCDCSDDSGCRIRLKFYAMEPAQKTMPLLAIKEVTAEAKTVITFDRVSEINREFDYGQIINSPLIESVDYQIKDGHFVIIINRKGAYLPAEVSVQESLATIALAPAAKNYPLVSNQAPANDSAAFPALHPISFDVSLASPLKSVSVFFQGKPVEFETATTTENGYRFSFKKNLEIDKEYSVKAIIADDMGRTVVSSWNFYAQIPSAVALGKDRFKFLGWWGEINSNGVAVRKGVATASDKLGSLSSANRVKVIKEVYGDWVDGKNLWYQIDGGMYPGAYVFSDFVTPMAQPQPPQNFTVPEGVKAGENWIDVDLTKKVFTLFAYDKPIFATYISPGREGNETQTGTFRIWYKLRKAEMKGGPPLHTYRYHLKNIPWTMFYNYDYAIHGTYWHDRFGSQQSAGCTNMTQGDAKFVFDNTLPIIPDGKTSVFARSENGKGTGTVVYNHD
jgi:lipoprotein-anchoring transpeptidase ErfK/SrfK